MHGFKGAFTVVKVAHETPRHYVKKGELLNNYKETDGAKQMPRLRRSSIAAREAGGAKKLGGIGNDEKVEDADIELGEVGVGLIKCLMLCVRFECHFAPETHDSLLHHGPCCLLSRLPMVLILSTHSVFASSSPNPDDHTKANSSTHRTTQSYQA